MKKVDYDLTTGEIKGFYDTNIHGSIPNTAIYITEEQWHECIENQGLRAIDVNLKSIIEITKEPLPPQPTQEDYMLDLDYRLSKIELGV